MSIADTVRNIFRIVRWPDLAVRIRHCPACARKSLMLRLAKDEIWVRCTRCRASSVTLSLISVLRSHCSRQLQGSAYEMSARGALFAFLQGHCSSLVGSEFVEGAEPGSVLNGIRCEDVQALNFGDNQFDLVTSTEVFEHVPDDRAGFREVFRVLKNGGCFAFTVPLHDAAETLQRVALGHSGQPVHLLPPEYHEDPANPGKPVLTYRNYGRDITGALKQAGFDEARLVDPQDRIPWGYARRVIVAWKHSKPVAANLAEV